MLCVSRLEPNRGSRATYNTAFSAHIPARQRRQAHCLQTPSKILGRLVQYLYVQALSDLLGLHWLVPLLVIYEVLATQGGKILQLAALPGAAFVRDARRKASFGAKDATEENAGTMMSINTILEDRSVLIYSLSHTMNLIPVDSKRINDLLVRQYWTSTLQI